MKKHNEQFEQNIARLVKSTGENQIPSENFTQNLIDEALKELPQNQPQRQRSKTMKSIIKSFIKISACIIVVGGFLSFFIIPALMPVGQRADHAVELAKQRELTVLNYRNGYTTTHWTLGEQESAMPSMAHGGDTPPNGEAVDAMFFKTYGVNPFVDTEDDRLSTFAIDVDTGSYTICRRYLNEGNLPPKEAVRVEEFVNYFKYDYPAPREHDFAVFFETMPWQLGRQRKNTHLMRIGLKAMEVPDEYRKPAILTFVIDVSGSMDRENRLGLVKQSLRLLVDKLRPEDQIGIAVYGDSGYQVLAHTGLENKRKILRAIHSLKSEGSTNAEEGIRIGYAMADESFTPGHINRVILCSDGVANVGNTGHEEIFKQIKAKADKGVTLSTLGFGMGNYNDVLMERLGDKGNGYYAYIDTLDEAKRLFSNLTGALQVVARDVKIQVDFNPDVVRSYRLIGYENRDVADIDFRNDTVDGGEIGAGHSTTALYELKLWPEAAGDIATTHIRYKDPDTFEVTEISAKTDTAQIAKGFDYISESFATASVVTEFAEIMRDSYWAKSADLQETLDKAKQLQTVSSDADLKELVGLMTLANAHFATMSDNPAMQAAKIEVMANMDLTPIPLELPKPAFIGTPESLEGVTNLEKPLGKARPAFYAPVGTANVALGKPVTAYEEEPIMGTLDMIVDGDKEAAGGSLVELGPFEQWIQIDLQQSQMIYAIVFWHYHKMPRVYFDIVVQISDDPDFATDVTTVFNNDMDNSLGLGVGNDKHYIETAEGKLVDAKGNKGRYVRLYSQANSMNDYSHYLEVEVYGKPAGNKN